MNKFAQQLGRLAKGRPKTLTEPQREAARQRLAKARLIRWRKEAAQ